MMVVFDSIITGELKSLGFQELSTLYLPTAVKYKDGKFEVSSVNQLGEACSNCWVRFNAVTKLLEFVESDGETMWFRSMVPGPMACGGMGSLTFSNWFKFEEATEVISILRSYEDLVSTLTKG